MRVLPWILGPRFSNVKLHIHNSHFQPVDVSTPSMFEEGHTMKSSFLGFAADMNEKKSLLQCFDGDAAVIWGFFLYVGRCGIRRGYHHLFFQDKLLY